MDDQRQKLMGFAGLEFEFSIDRMDPGVASFELLVSATGTRPDRERWLHGFQRWCDLHGLRPEVIRGNSRTNRTATRTVVACKPSIQAFLFHWIGGDWLRYSQQNATTLSAVENWQIAALRQQIVKLEERVLQSENCVDLDSMIPNRRPRRTYSTRLTAFARSRGGDR